VRVLVVVGSVVFTLLLLEGAFRVVGALGGRGVADVRSDLQRAHDMKPVPSPSECTEHGAHNATLGAIFRMSDFHDVVFELKPDVNTCAIGGKRVVTNHAGYRDTRDYALEKPKGVFRIVGIGDSYMFGMGVNNDDVYLVALGRLLKERGIDAELINTAVPGYNTAQEAAVLERRGMAYHPDLILVGYVGNDMGLPNFLQTSPRFSTLRRSYLVDFVLTRVAQLPLGSASTPPRSATWAMTRRWIRTASPTSTAT
jgi:hypothetical protein